MPGERLELLLDLTGHEAEVFHLMAYNSDLPNGILGAAQVGMGAVFLDGYEQNALNGADFPILSLQVNGPTTDPVMSIPSTLVPTQPFSEADATRTRNFILQPESPGPLEMIEGPFMINGEVFDMDVINEVVELGTTEIWSFQNNTQIGHPMHIHDIQFNILDRNGAAPEPWESGWKDVVYVPPMGSARVITRFDDFADPEMPYMYHCHMLMHEDEGLMGQFLVVDGVGIDAAPGASLDLRLSPNPSTGETLRLVLPGYEGAATMELIDALGRSSMSTVVSFRNGSASVPVASLSPGTYALVLRSARDQSTFTTRLVLQP